MDKQREALFLLYNEKKHSILEICQIMGISKQTLYNYLQQDEAGKAEESESKRKEVKHVWGQTEKQENTVSLAVRCL